MKVNEIITEAANPAQQAAIAISMKKAGKKPRSQINELAPDAGGGGSGNYFQALASAWYNHDISMLADIARKGGSPMKKIMDAQEAVEKMLQRGVIGSDGKTRKYDITYNSDFDGVVIQSADYYEYSDYDAAGNEIDSRTGRPWGPNDYMEFDGNDLDEGIYEASPELTEEFDLIESIIERLAAHNGVDAEVIWEDLETLTEDELYAFAVTSEPIMESQGVTEAFGLYGPFTVTINTGERPQSRTKTKKFRREDDAILYAEDWLEDAPQYVFATAKVTDPAGNVVWTTDEQGVAEGSGDDFYAMALQKYPQLKRVDREIVINALNNAHEDYLMHYGYEGIGPEEESSMIDHAVKGLKQGMAEGVPQPGPSSGAPKQFGSDAKIQTRQMTVKDIISSIPGVPYYNNVVDDWDAKDYGWGVTKKVIEYATYLKDHPESLAKLPPAIVLNGKFEDGAHRVSAIWLLQQRMDPKNPLWKNAKLNVQFVQQGVAEDWQKANKRDRTAGMSQKAVNAYRRENPGSKLKTAVTTKPSKLKRGSKASKRRKSYCSRSRGQMKMHSISCAKTPDKAICKARRRWNC